MPSTPPKPLIAVVLSLLLPGLGHLYAGRSRAAVLWTIAAGVLLPGAALLLFLPGVVGGLLYAGAIPFLYIALLHSAYRAAVRPGPRLPVWAYVVFIATAIPARATGAVAIRTGLVRPLRAVDDTMAPALLPGDNAVARVGALARAIERGQVVVFRPPDGAGGLEIRRVIGLPGERVAMRGGQLYLDGVPVPRVPSGAVSWVGVDCREREVSAATEELGGRAITVLDTEPPLERSEELVPGGHYLLAGDARSDWAAVPAQNILGQAQRIWLSAEPCGSPLSLRLDRLGPIR